MNHQIINRFLRSHAFTLTLQLLDRRGRSQAGFLLFVYPSSKQRLVLSWRFRSGPSPGLLGSYSQTRPREPSQRFWNLQNLQNLQSPQDCFLSEVFGPPRASFCLLRRRFGAEEEWLMGDKWGVSPV